MSSANLDQLLRSAVTHQRSGRLQDALSDLHRALEINPQHPDALYLSGMIALQQRRPTDAVDLLTRAADAKPQAAEISANLGHALRSLGRLEDAAMRYQRAIQINPKYALAHTNLGAIRRQQSRLGEAVDCFRTALRIDPKQIGAWMNLGNALRDMNRFDEAVDAYGQASSLDPAFADSRGAAATVLNSTGKSDQAEALFREALRINPKHVASLVNFGMLLRNRGDFPAAIEVLRQAVQHAPDSADAHEKLARTLWAACHTDEAIRHFEQVMRIAPSPRMKMLLATLVPPVYRSAEEVQTWRNRLEREVSALKQGGFTLDVTSVPPPSVVYLPYQGLPDRDIARDIASLCRVAPPRASAFSSSPGAIEDDDAGSAPPAPATSTPAPFARRKIRERTLADAFGDEGLLLEEDDSDQSGATRPASPRSTSQPSTSKLRVGFISSLFKNQTVGLWTRGLIAKLARDRFHVVTLSTAPHNDEIGRFIREHSDQYVVLPVALPAARDVVRAQNLDVLIYADLGMDPWMTAMAYARLAPVQCVTVGHPITTGIETIDYYISSSLAERGPDAQDDYTEKLVQLEHLPVYYYRPRPPVEPATRREFDIPEDANLYGCLQAQYKLHPQFDAAIAGILRGDPKGMVLLSRGGTAFAEHLIAARLREACPDVVDRVKFLPAVERDKFRALTNLCDVLLAPFPFGAGDSALEGFALGLPTVTMPTPHLKGRLTAAMYKAMGIDDCTAATVEQYVEIALKLGRHHEYNRTVREKIRAADGALFDNDAGVKDLERFLLSAAGNKGTA